MHHSNSSRSNKTLSPSPLLLLRGFVSVFKGTLKSGQNIAVHNKLMDWKKRFAIAMNIAEGIQILHCLIPPIIHGDIKLSTILIDAFFNAKLADFGLAQALTSLSLILYSRKNSGCVWHLWEERQRKGT